MLPYPSPINGFTRYRSIRHTLIHLRRSFDRFGQNLRLSFFFKYWIKIFEKKFTLWSSRKSRRPIELFWIKVIYLKISNYKSFQNEEFVSSFRMISLYSERWVTTRNEEPVSSFFTTLLLTLTCRLNLASSSVLLRMSTLLCTPSRARTNLMKSVSSFFVFTYLSNARINFFFTETPTNRYFIVSIHVLKKHSIPSNSKLWIILIWAIV